MTRLDVIQLLQASGPLPLKTIALKLHASQFAAADMLRRLEALGYVRKPKRGQYEWTGEPYDPGTDIRPAHKNIVRPAQPRAVDQRVKWTGIKISEKQIQANIDRIVARDIAARLAPSA